MAGSSIKKYVVTEMYASESFPVDWSVIPDVFLDNVSRNLYNVSALTEDGDIIERTVVFLKPVKNFDAGTNTVEIDNGSVIIGKL